MLSDLGVNEVKALKKPGRHRVSKGLYLQVDGGSRAWLHRFMLNGVSHDMGLGSYDLVSLAKARDLVIDARRLAAAGQCPLAARKAARPVVRPTFKTVAVEYHQAHANGWKNVRFRAQWLSQLEQYVFPRLGGLPIDAITSELVRDTFKPIWPANPQAEHPLASAKTILDRVTVVWDHAKAQKHVTGDNPAAWEGCQQTLLGEIKAKKVHKPSMPWAELPGFMMELRAKDTVAARALEFTILTGVRTDDTLAALWNQIDLELRTWTIPATKNDDEHCVPLSDAALRLLLALKTNRTPDSPIFATRGVRLGANAMLQSLNEFGRTVLVKGEFVPVTVHGFRASLKTWGLEHDYAEIVLEMALAHRQKAEILKAYTRGSLFNKRTKLMAEWATHCGG